MFLNIQDFWNVELSCWAKANSPVHSQGLQCLQNISKHLSKTQHHTQEDLDFTSTAVSMSYLTGYWTFWQFFNHWLKHNQNLGGLTTLHLHFKQVQSPDFDNLPTAIWVVTLWTLKFIFITLKKSIPTSTKKNAFPLQRPNDYCCLWK